ncbi:MAG: hypothetical protein ABIO16_03900 [Nocardioides sp.]
MTDLPENPHAGQGSVMLDIGGDIGALVIIMPASMLGQEIEIDRVGNASSQEDESSHEHGHGHGHGHGHSHRAHVAVVDRPVPGGTQPSLVFPELTEGSYELFDKGADEVLLTADIVGGEVTFMEWPTH